MIKGGEVWYTWSILGHWNTPKQVVNTWQAFLTWRVKVNLPLTLKKNFRILEALGPFRILGLRGCHVHCQDRKFVEQDKCEVCQDVQLEMFPHMTFQELCQLYHKLSKSKDKAEVEQSKEIAAAIARKAKMIADGMINDLNPSSDVFMESSYGFMIYQDVGLATKDDIHRWTNQTPKVLGLQGLKFKLDGPDKPSTELFPVSLIGLPLDELMGIRKSRQYMDNSITRDEFHLLHDYQLAKAQSKNMFGFVNDKFASQRPARLSAMGSLVSKADLEEKGRKIESKAALNVEAASSAPAEEPESDSDSVDSDGNPIRKAKRKVLDLGSLGDENAKKTKAKAKAKHGAGKAKATMKGNKGRAGRESEEEREEREKDSLAEVESSLGGKREEEVSQLDDDLKSVATVHLQGNRNASILCLKKLTVQQFLVEPKLGQTIHGARGCETFKQKNVCWNICRICVFVKQSKI